MTAKTAQAPPPVSAEQKLKELNLDLPAPPLPFGIYAEVVRTGSLLLLSGMLPTEGRGAKCVGRVGAELDAAAGRNVADGASDLLQDVFGRDKHPTCLVYGVASLPFGTPVELELIFETQS